MRLIEVNLRRQQHQTSHAFTSDECLQIIAVDDFDVLILNPQITGHASVSQILKAAEGRMKVVMGPDESNPKGS